MDQKGVLIISKPLLENQVEIGELCHYLLSVLLLREVQPMANCGLRWTNSNSAREELGNGNLTIRRWRAVAAGGYHKLGCSVICRMETIEPPNLEVVWWAVMYPWLFQSRKIALFQKGSLHNCRPGLPAPVLGYSLPAFNQLKTFYRPLQTSDGYRVRGPAA